MMNIRLRALRCGVATIALAAAASAAAQTGAPDRAPGNEDAAPANGIRNTDDVIVTGSRVNRETPITSSVLATEPQAIVSRSIIENSVPPTADFSDVVLLTPGASGTSNGNGPGLSESKTVLRGFQDGQFNVTYDGIPFGDSNDPTHHSTAYFPTGTYERIIIDRGPGGATDLGQASYGGNIHLISREASNRPGVDAQAVYGSYNTYLGRLTLNTGSIDKLGGLKVIGVGEYKHTDGALSYSRAWFANGFMKAELPLGEKAKFSILSSYNQDFYHQSDNNGVTCTGSINFTGSQTDGNNCVAGSQVALYGKSFGLLNPNDGRFANSLYSSSRYDWNWTRKYTDFEIARLQVNLTENLSIDNKAYTYFYKNFTVSTETSTTLCTGGIATATTCGGMTTTLQGATPIIKGKALPGDIPGYTKLNQYRNYGDIFQINLKTSFGVGHVGVWYESSKSHRLRYDYDFTRAFGAGAFGDGFFDFTATSNFYNDKEKNAATNIQQDGTQVPLYVKYDERTGWEQVQGFGEFNFELFDERLTLTPGVKVQNFTRTINTFIAAQSTRAGINAQDSYKPTLPYATARFLAQPNWSFYGQFAKGFLIPSLGNSLETVLPATGGGIACPAGVSCNIQPTKTTNYQAGTVYAGDRLNVDADVYYIKTSNSTSIDPSSGVAVQTNGSATYKGVEAQASYLFVRGLTAIVNGSIASSKDDATKHCLAQAPNYTALAGVVYNTQNLKLSYLQKFTGRQFADTGVAPVTTTTTVGGVTTTTTSASIYNQVRIAPYSTGIASGTFYLGPVGVGVTVYNVFDDRSTTKIGGSTGATPLYFFQPGRSYEAQVRFRF